MYGHRNRGKQSFHFFFSSMALPLLFFCLTSIMVSPSGGRTIVAARPNGFSVEMIPRDSPKSPLYPGNLTETQRLNYLSCLSKDRARALQLALTSRATITTSTNNRKINPEDILPKVSGTPHGYYVVKVQIGSQKEPFFLMLDTGSDVTWVQCDGCNPCIKVKDGGSFKFHFSSTYRLIRHDNPICNPVISPYEYCMYKISYGDGVFKTEGVLSSDFIIFETENESEYEALKVVFGCSSATEGLELGSENTIAGIFGLGGGIPSFLAQTQARFGQRFSYCLQSLVGDNTKSSKTYLHFGDDASFPEDTPPTGTPFVITDHPANYHLDVVDMSIGDTRLYIPPSTFKTNQDGTAGFIIDSGSVYSMLGSNGFDLLTAGVAKYFEPYKLQRIPQVEPDDIFEFCYGKPYPDFDKLFPTITFHFRNGANFVVQPSVAFYSSDKEFCLTFLKFDSEISILGAYHQVNYKILYDATLNSLFFAQELCVYK